MLDSYFIQGSNWNSCKFVDNIISSPGGSPGRAIVLPPASALAVLAKC